MLEELSSSPWLIGLSVVCFILACFGSLLATSLLVYSPTKLARLCSTASGEALLADLAGKDKEYQVVARCYALGGLVGAFLCLQAGVAGPRTGWALGMLGILALVFCGVLPSALGAARAEGTLLRTLPALRLCLQVFRWPVVLPTLWVTTGMLRLLRIRSEPTNDPGAIAEEVLAAVSDSVTEEALPAEEKRWIGNILGLKELRVAEVMTQRTDVVTMQADTPLRQAVALALQHGFSRYPVYGDRIDDIIGVFYVKDALPLVMAGEPGQRLLDPAAPLRSLLREPFFVPETLDVAQLLRQFRQNKQQMAIVVDEYGGTVGLVSVEDAVEEIVGEFADEYDAKKAAAPTAEGRVTVIAAGRVVEVPARLPVEELNKLLGTDLREDGNYDTVGGFVTSHMNRIPVVGERVTMAALEFQVLAADDLKVGRLRVTALQPQPAQQDG